MRVLTWNLWWRLGPWEERQPAIHATLAELAADICGLQEVWATADTNQAQVLAEGLGFHWAWSRSPLGPALASKRDGVDVGLGLLSRWPIVEREELVLTPTPDVDARTRTVLHAVVDAPDGTVPVFVVHLPSAPWASAERCLHVRELVEFIVERGRGHRHRPVVLGDFNALEDSDEMRLLSGHKTAPVVPGVSLLDVWSYAGPGSGGETMSGRNPHARGHPNFAVRIDYVLLGFGGELGTEGRVRRVAVAGDVPVDGVVASDHYAVVADLEW